MGNLESQCQGNKCGVECPYDKTEWDESQGQDHYTSSFVRRHQVLSDAPPSDKIAGPHADWADGEFEKTPSFTKDSINGGWEDGSVPRGPPGAPAAAPEAPEDAPEAPERVRPASPQRADGGAAPRTPPPPSIGIARLDLPPSAELAPGEGRPELHGPGGGSGRTARDWAKDQEQFRHLPALPEGWIHVKSKSSGEIYFYCLDTGEATFQAPSDLPAGWTSVKSRTTGQTYYWNAQLQTSQFKRPGVSDVTSPRSIRVPATIHE